MAKVDLTLEQACEIWAYDPVEGIITWRIRGSRKVGIGDVAGSPNGHGYVCVGFNYRLYKAHRIAWLLMKGRWPDGEIDHINGIRDDNRWANLREVHPSINQQNRQRAHRNSKSGILGVSFDRGKWRAQIRSDGEYICIGRYATKQEAEAAYLAAKRQLHAGNTL